MNYHSNLPKALPSHYIYAYIGKVEVLESLEHNLSVKYIYIYIYMYIYIYTLPMNINEYTPFLLNMLDTIEQVKIY